MKCKFCGKPAVIKLRAYNLKLCDDHFVSFIEQRVEKTVKKYKLFKRDDRILVGVSGGKDSLNTIFILNKLGYKTEGLYIDLGIGSYSENSKEKALKFAEEFGMKIHIYEVKKDFGMGITEIARLLKRKPCSVCGVIKRYILNKYAYENNFSVLATGHNLDDETATLFSNILSWQEGYLARQNILLPQKSEKLVKKVKPLALISEKESAAYAFLKGIDYIKEECPNAHGATSIFYKNIINQIEEKQPSTKLRFYLDFIRKGRKFFQNVLIEREEKLQPCEVCGFPTTRKVCLYCSIKDAIQKRGGNNGTR